jgi:hypothetical protein
MRGSNAANVREQSVGQKNVVVGEVYGATRSDLRPCSAVLISRLKNTVG